MNRSSFLKRAVAALAGIVVGSKLEGITPVEKEVKPGKSDKTLTLELDKDWIGNPLDFLIPGDIIRLRGHDYYVYDTEGEGREKMAKTQCLRDTVRGRSECFMIWYLKEHKALIHASPAFER